MPKHERGQARARIQEVALELFAEQGYDHTSLREIADRIGVTKAAIYYHFESKDDIIAATGAEFLTELDKLVAWAGEQALSENAKRELLERYAAVVERRWPFMRFFQQNPTVAQSSETFAQFKDRIEQLMTLLTDGQNSFADRLRGRLALISMHVAHSKHDHDDVSDEERTKAALEVAMDLVDRSSR